LRTVWCAPPQIKRGRVEIMKSKTKIWLGVGAFVVAGVNSASAEAPNLDRFRGADSVSSIAINQALSNSVRFAAAKKKGDDWDEWGEEGGEGERGAPKKQIKQGGEGERGAPKRQVKQGGEAGERGARKKSGGEHGAHAMKKKHGGEAGEGGGGGSKVKLPPDLDFALKISQIRGHLLVGDELVKQGQWNAALPHFLHPTEELYGPIRGRLKDYNTPQFADALKALANTVKQKKGGDEYDKAFKAVDAALMAADGGLKTKQKDWEDFQLEATLELLRSATGEYKEAIVKGRIAKPVEYQDARGFVWQSEKMIEAIAPALEKKNAEGLKQMRAGYAELKKAWPEAMAPKTPVKDYATVLGDVSRIEVAAGKLM
jgi:hypothetical protein